MDPLIEVAHENVGLRLHGQDRDGGERECHEPDGRTPRREAGGLPGMTGRSASTRSGRPGAGHSLGSAEPAPHQPEHSPTRRTSRGLLAPPLCGEPAGPAPGELRRCHARVPSHRCEIRAVLHAQRKRRILDGGGDALRLPRRAIVGVAPRILPGQHPVAGGHDCALHGACPARGEPDSCEGSLRARGASRPGTRRPGC